MEVNQKLVVCQIPDDNSLRNAPNFLSTIVDTASAVTRWNSRDSICKMPGKIQIRNWHRRIKRSNQR